MDDVIETLAGDIAAVLMDGGFSPLPEGQMQGLVCRRDGLGWWMGGVFSDGRTHSAHSAISPNTPSDPVDFAHYLVAHARRLANPLAADVTFAPPPVAVDAPEGDLRDETHSEAGANVDDGGIAELVSGGDDVRVRLSAGVDDVEPRQTESVDGGSGENADHFGALAHINAPADGRDEYGNRVDDPPFEDFTTASDLDEDPEDAEYSEVDLDALASEPTPLIEGADIAPEPEPEASPAGVAIFGDNIHTIRLAKKGRLDEIARRKKGEAMGEWNMGEFREQQSQLSRFARGELGAGPDAQAHFAKIESIVKSLDAIERYHEIRALLLDSPSREYVESFDPEEGWP